MLSAVENYEQAVTVLLDKLSNHPTIIKFQAAESRLKRAENLYALENDMKELAKQATLYKKIDKVNAYKITLERSKEIEQKLNDEPLIIDYRRKLAAANAVLQHVLENLEIQINEAIHGDN
ncbi:hypothetical protein Hs30E_19030 [Lactococcus hodotermopsidis]|uniref:Uncharacterized protein n=1 Tax=Pseudolactococcus hodotermopsidis TaxID=2709157 RepID=A0A6A0BD69_9LACT|nr:YlbF family regulator [Lactococcus hodotermopsidis]GFH43352.1 hypothetical protein Hs30E_19030 [Lactococcus hodotermopsidis]